MEAQHYSELDQNKGDQMSTTLAQQIASAADLNELSKAAHAINHADVDRSTYKGLLDEVTLRLYDMDAEWEDLDGLDAKWDGDVCSCGLVKTANGDLCVDLLAPVPKGTCRC